MIYNRALVDINMTSIYELHTLWRDNILWDSPLGRGTGGRAIDNLLCDEPPFGTTPCGIASCGIASCIGQHGTFLLFGRLSLCKALLKFDNYKSA